jgi:asparagine synthase (glutamine-hydrolysing)
MCGIAAVIGEDGSKTQERARNALDVLRHRGPDDSSIWSSPSGKASLAHARLSTVDFKNGRQPIPNEDNSVIAVVNGEFYETSAIRQHLENLGHRFRSRSDSEVLVHLYEQCGLACLNQLQGCFAFAVWDERKQLLFAARDRFGAKPLYYCEQEGEMMIASEVKGLQRAGVNLEWDEQGFYEQFAFQSCLSGGTLYKGVRELQAGHYLLRTDTSLQVIRYWDINYESPAEQEIQSDDFYAEQLLEALDRAVECRLQADVPVACYLSGGIDSSSILGLMSRHVAANELTAFCVSFDSPELDEFDIAARSAALVGARLVKVPVSASTLADDFKKTIWHCENLIGNANAVAKYSLSRAARDAGYRVVLSGEGADELFAGYPHLVTDTRRGLDESARKELQNKLGVSAEQLELISYPLGRVASSLVLDKLGYSPIWLEVRHRVMKQFSGVLPRAFGALEMDNRLLDSLDVAGQMNGRSPLNQSCYLQLKTCLSGVTLPSLGDRVEMAHSIESRLPFLDQRVVDLARRLPDWMKVRGGAEKYVLRKAMRAVVSPEVCGRRKYPITAPAAMWEASSALGTMLQDTLRSRYLDAIPFVNRPALLAILDATAAEKQAARSALEAPMMALASACVLAKTLSIA